MMRWSIAFFFVAACSTSTSSVTKTSKPDAAVPTNDLAMSVDLGTTPDLATSPDASPATTKYAVDGTIAVTTMDIDVTGGPDDFTFHAYLPGSTGTHPVVVFESGFQQPGSAYAGYAQRLASYGVVALVRDDPGAFSSTTTSDLADDLTYVVATWLPAQSSSGPLSGMIDVAHVGFAGHSRGGQATLLSMEGGAKGKVAAWVGVDPVDTAASSGAPQARTTIATIAAPLLFIGGGTSTGCSPATDNYAVLYGDAVSPALSLTIVNASHTEFEDPSSCSFCSFCTPMGTADATQVLAESIHYLTAFFARQLLGDSSVGATLVGAGVETDIASGSITRASK